VTVLVLAGLGISAMVLTAALVFRRSHALRVRQRAVLSSDVTTKRGRQARRRAREMPSAGPHLRAARRPGGVASRDLSVELVSSGIATPDWPIEPVPGAAGQSRWRVASLSGLLGASWWRVAGVSLGLGASAGYLLGGPVAAFALGIYAMVGALAVRRSRAEAARRRDRSALLDRLTGLAADLRAGVPVPTAMRTAVLAEATTGNHPTGLAADLRAGIPVPTATQTVVFPETAKDDHPSIAAGSGLVALAQAAATLAERTGAPLADLIDRIEADARANDRAVAAAAAQAAGAQATALLLAALPLGGLALGYTIGTDPLTMLLHTPLGAACAVGAIALQSLGLVWSNRLQPRPSLAAGVGR
jgi:tight adherence protein B